MISPKKMSKDSFALKINRPHEIGIRDRRRGVDRRAASRFAVNIEIFWETLAGTERGIISDISAIGCFILCSGLVTGGETVKIYIPLINGQKIKLWGEVVNHVFELGFGLRFVELGKTEKEFLEKLTEKLSRRIPANTRGRRIN